MAKTTREEIVKRARDLFRTRGFDGFSMADLAAQVGMRKASLYSRFTSKEEIACVSLNLTLEEIAALKEDHDDWLVVYQSLLERCADYLVGSKRCIGLHFAYGAQSPTLQAATKSFFLDLQHSFAEILSEGMPQEDANRLARDSLAHIEGATLWLALDDDSGPMTRGIETLVETAKGLAHPDR